MRSIAFRCDGDERVGAGHVARCLQLAAACEEGGIATILVGRYAGLAAKLVTAAGAATSPPDSSPVGVAPTLAGAAVVDSYALGRTAIEGLAARMPVAAICDGDQAPRATAVLDYRLDAPARLTVPGGTVGILGAAYAPVAPTYAAARRQRGFARALVTGGGSRQGVRHLSAAVAALRRRGDLEIAVAGSSSTHRSPGSPLAMAPPRLENGLLDRIRWADVAISAAGFTSYELACAGVPSVIVAIAPNQAPIAASFHREGAAIGVGVQGGDELEAALNAIADPGRRRRLATAGPALLDGLGASRSRDALVAAFSGRPLPRVLRYRPAEAIELPETPAGEGQPGAERHILAVEDGAEMIAALEFRIHEGRGRLRVRIDPRRRGIEREAQVVREASELILGSRPDATELEAAVGEATSPRLETFLEAGYREAAQASALTGHKLLTLDRAALRAALCT